MRARSILAVLSASALAFVGLAAGAAHSSTPPADGYYACSFDTAFHCDPAAIPTVTETATVTATATATVTATPAPVPPLVGESFGGSTSAAVTSATTAYPEQRVGRFYWTGLPATYSATAALVATKPGETLIVSFKSMPTDAAFAADLADWQASGHTIYWTFNHEPENNGLTPAQYVADWNHLLGIAATLHHTHVHSMSVLIADDLRTGTAEQWYVPGVDVLGFDCYQLANEPRALAYAAAKGKPVAFPEFGAGTVAGQTDAQSLAYAKAFIGALDANTVAAAWYNAGPNALSSRPLTLAYLRTQ